MYSIAFERNVHIDLDAVPEWNMIFDYQNFTTIPKFTSTERLVDTFSDAPNSPSCQHSFQDDAVKIHH